MDARPVDPGRRNLLRTLLGLAAAPAWSSRPGSAFDASPPGAVAPARRFGIAYTSFAVRLRQGRDLIRGTAAGAGGFPAEAFVDLCQSFGADGCQMDTTQLTSTDDAYLAGVRRRIHERGLFLELSVSGKVLESAPRFAEIAALAQKLGAARLRVALLHGRRYEDFRTKEQWEEFAGHWRRTLPKAKPWLEDARLPVGIENHKDFRIHELVELIRSVDTPYLGACVDFGNNVAFLEDPLELAEALAPYAVTTHLKDMAVRPYEHGFELSEVPLGQGFLPLARMVEVLRQRQANLPLCLEMITRDPLRVPYLHDEYWTTFGGRDDRRIERFRAEVLSKAWTEPLPRISGLPIDGMIAAEDDNVRRCAAFAREKLGA
jgi:3-oxoisoapionate decarboxylase